MGFSPVGAGECSGSLVVVGFCLGLLASCCEGYAFGVSLDAFGFGCLAGEAVVGAVVAGPGSESVVEPGSNVADSGGAVVGVSGIAGGAVIDDVQDVVDDRSCSEQGANEGGDVGCADGLQREKPVLALNGS